MRKIAAHLKYFLSCDIILHRKYVPLPQNRYTMEKKEIKLQMKELIKLMSEGVWEKEDIFSLTLLSSIAGESIFLLGPPGTGKSMIARRLKEVFSEKRQFEYLMSRFSTPDEIFGPVSISKLKDEDTYERRTEGYLPWANVVFLDEIWKAGPSIQNALLTAINEKIYQNGNETISLPMKALIAASNELPKEDEGLEALWDRFILRVVSNPISNERTFYKMLMGKSKGKIIIPDELLITDEQYAQILDEVENIDIPDYILKDITFIRKKLKDADAQDEEASPLDYYISDRRWKKAVHLLQTSAFLNGRKGIDKTDLPILYHVLWNKVETIEPVMKIVTESLFWDIEKKGQAVEKDYEKALKTKGNALEDSKIANVNSSDFNIYFFFYVKLTNTSWGDTYFFLQDYGYLLLDIDTKGVMYFDKDKNGWVIRRLPQGPFSSKKYPQHQIVSLRRARGGVIVNNALYMMESSKSAPKPVFPPSTEQQNLFSEEDSYLVGEMQKVRNELSLRLQELEQENLFVASMDLKVIQKYANNLQKKYEALEMKIKTSI